MKIDRVVLTHVLVPLVEPFRISSGAIAAKDGIVVALHSDGLTGYGESSPMSGSFYSVDTPAKSWDELCNVVVPGIIGQAFEGPEDWNAALDKLPAGNFTKTGVETAFWDIEAQRQHKPLHEMLGGTTTQVRSGLAVGLYDDVNEMLRTIERYLVDGYHRVKLKIEPRHDIEIVRAARKRFGNIPLFVDANGAYSLQHLDVFRALDDFDLMMFEQPFAKDALEDLAVLQQAILPWQPQSTGAAATGADHTAACPKTRSRLHRMVSANFILFVRLADFDDELIRVFIEIFFAGLAAQFHFLIFVGKNQRLAHVAVELLAGHGAGRQFVRLGWRGGRGAVRRREVGGQRHDAEGAGREQKE